MSIQFLPRNNYQDLYRVATVDSTTKEKNDADIALDGINDQIKINELVINLQSSRGGTIMIGAGQLYTSSHIKIDGKGSTNTPTVNLIGAGTQATIINCSSDTNGILLMNAYSGECSGFGVNVSGSGVGFEVKAGDENGIFSGVGIRGCYNAEIKNITVKSDTPNTSLAFKLGNPFRSTFANLEGFGTYQGMRIYAQDDTFNGGDCKFDRLFMEIMGGAGSYAYCLDSDVLNTSTSFVGQINQCQFNIMQGFAQSDGGTGLKLTGKWAIQNNTFNQISLQQFKTIIDNQSSNSCRFNLDYCSNWTGANPLPNQAGIRSGVEAVKNVYTGNSGFVNQAVMYIEDNSQSLATRNIYQRLRLEAGPLANITYSGTAFTQITQSMVSNANGGTVDPIYNPSM